ncbi:MAG: hypothetical protein IKT84_00725 [Bacteroidales bacterium]|nr:hypothetical protein [Bacteroidales bacterium]
MKQRIKYLLILLSISALAIQGCEEKRHHKLFGSWILEGSGKTSKEIKGFTLGKNGLASTINEPRHHYERWVLKNNNLIIEGKLIADSCFTPLSDTFYVEYVSKEELIVFRNEIKYHYIKEQ